MISYLFRHRNTLGSSRSKIAPGIGFEPVSHRLTGSRSEKHRLVDLNKPEKPVHVFATMESTNKLSGHDRTEPVAQCFREVVYHIKRRNNNFRTYTDCVKALLSNKT